MVYVDEPVFPFGRMMMCHMIADSPEELRAMADRIGVARRWVQKPGTPWEHFDICKERRARAIAAGAKTVTSRSMVAIRWALSVAPALTPTPES